MGTVAAFFDIDGTIYREGLITELFKKMINYDLIDMSKWHTEVRPAFLDWDKRKGDYDTYLQKMVEVYKEALEGMHPFHMEYAAKKVVEQKGERVYTFSRSKIKWHQQQGHKVIAISGSPIELVREMSNKYGMDDYRGTIYQKNTQGTYNGKVIPMWDSVSKQKAMRELVKKYDIDLNKSYAYGDTAGDFTMFQMVGYPFAINPTKELLTKILEDIELRHKIQVVVERKDVTYFLNIEQIQFQ